jgi:DNA-binding MarR family transcriptional regulator
MKSTNHSGGKLTSRPVPRKAPEGSAISVWIRFLKAYNLIVREARMRLSDHCTIAQFDILAQLSREKNGSTLTDLSKRLLVTAGNLTGVVDRMEKLELVRRNSDSKDRRITRVQLTEKGKLLAKTVIPRHSKDIDQLFSTLDQKELGQMRELLDKLIHGLEI